MWSSLWFKWVHASVIWLKHRLPYNSKRAHPNCDSRSHTGPLRWGAKVLAQCNNLAVISIVNHGMSKNQEAIRLARCLSFITATRIKGTHNIHHYLGKISPYSATTSPSQPGSVPQSLLDHLILSKPDWISKRWIELWSTTVLLG